MSMGRLGRNGQTWVKTLNPRLTVNFHHYDYIACRHYYPGKNTRKTATGTQNPVRTIRLQHVAV